MDFYANAWENRNPNGTLQLTNMNPRHETAHYQEWRSKQTSEILDRGRSASHDFEDEERYIQRMIKTVMRSHICYREVDAYTACLSANNLVSDRDFAQKGLVDVNQGLAQAKCPREIARYQSCMEAKSNHDTVIQAAATHPRCESRRKDFLICLRKNNKSSVLQQRNCYHTEYFPMLRCGLNALHDEYWKSVSGFSPAHEMHAYEIETDAKTRKQVAELRARLESENFQPTRSTP